MSANKQKQPEIETFPITRGPLLDTLEIAPPSAAQPSECSTSEREGWYE